MNTGWLETAPQSVRASVLALRLTPMTANGERLSTATGFAFQDRDKAVLVTNRHVVTGLRVDNGAFLDKLERVPVELEIRYPTAVEGEWVLKRERLVDYEGFDPVWAGANDPSWDVAALQLIEMYGAVTPVFTLEDPPAHIRPYPSSDLSIVGYPFGQVGGSGLAIWTRATVASHLDRDFDGKPAFLVDSRTREGQSGSPCVFYSAGDRPPPNERGSARIGYNELVLFGIYSGRINKESDLGVVWKLTAIREVIDRLHARTFGPD